MKTRPSVLIVDDDDGVRFLLSELLRELDVDVTEAASGDVALTKLQAEPVDLVVSDLRMPGLDGMALLERTRALEPPPKVVMITAHGSEQHAVQAMKLGAIDYFKKPFDVDELKLAVQRATETVRLDLDNRRLRAELVLSRHMVFRSEPMRRVATVVERVAPRDVTVLITGESGTGKERIAEAIVAASRRAQKAFIKFNCAALPLDLAEAELFGHREGAFTGAVRARQGVFREADGGTLFLDEVAELPLPVQGKLLRVLQDGEVRPLGEDRSQRVDVRIIAATNVDLSKEVASGKFREDLFYRLNVVRVDVPPLRERPLDVAPLVDHFVAKYCERFGLERLAVPERLRARLESRPWRGNVRELENLVERMVALSDGQRLAEPHEHEDAGPLGLKDRVEAYERGLVLEALRNARGNRSEAARRLAIGRVTLLDKLKKYGIGDADLDAEEPAA
jgi:DNA-binding NtrC family response regulator